MSSSQEIQVIAVLIAMSCSIPGVFLVLRNNAMMSDAISHSLLLGITLMYFLLGDLQSPWLLLGAGFMGLVTVWSCETLCKTKLVQEDSAMGIVFPLLFSVAIILISKYASQTHLDLDTVMVGELAFAPFQRLRLFGVDLGAKGIYQGAVLLLLNGGLVHLFFKELEVTTFDPILAGVMGISPVFFHYGLMSLVSVTAVGAFDAVGSILVIAFLTVPANTAYLLTHDLRKMLWIAPIMAGISSIIGFQIAFYYDLSIAGMISLVSGGILLLVFIFSPKQGLIYHWFRRKKQALAFAEMNLLFHVGAHQNTPKEREENGLATIGNHLYWEWGKLRRTMDSLMKKGELEVRDDLLFLTPKGEESSRLKTAQFLRK